MGPLHTLLVVPLDKGRSLDPLGKWIGLRVALAFIARPDLCKLAVGIRVTLGSIYFSNFDRLLSVPDSRVRLSFTHNAPFFFPSLPPLPPKYFHHRDNARLFLFHSTSCQCTLVPCTQEGAYNDPLA